MALVDERTEREVEEWAASFLGAFGALQFGGTGGLDPSRVATIGTAAVRRAGAGGVGGALTSLEQAYLAGKLAGAIGTNAVRRMSERQLRDALQRTGVALDDVDRARIAEANRLSAASIRRRASGASASIRTSIEQANRDWRGDLEAGRLPATAAARREDRLGRLRLLDLQIRSDLSRMTFENRRFIQTQSAQYFQEAQVVEAPQEEIVYKIPRLNAEFHCMRLHLSPNGMPIRYRLSEVIGNSNVGVPPALWSFTIGPVHPFCYCILHRESLERNPGPSKRRANARSEEVERFREKRGLPGGEIVPSDRPGGLTASQARRRGRSRAGLGGGARVIGEDVQPASARELREARAIAERVSRVPNRGSVFAEVSTSLERSAGASVLPGSAGRGGNSPAESAGSAGEECCAREAAALPEEYEKLLHVVRSLYGGDSPAR